MVDVTVTLGSGGAALLMHSDPIRMGIAGPRYWHFQRIEGWYSGAPVVTRKAKIGNADGDFYPGRSRRGGKQLAIVGTVYGGDHEDVEEMAYDLIAAAGSTDGLPVDLTVVSTGTAGTRTMRVSPDGVPSVEPFGSNRARFRIPLYAADSRKYGPDIATVVGVNANVNLTNDGTAESYIWAVVRGPTSSSGFKIESPSGTDRLSYFDTIVDLDEVTVTPFVGGRALYDDGSTVDDRTDNLAVFQWPFLAPGETRQVRFEVSSGSGANTQCTLHHSNAWW